MPRVRASLSAQPACACARSGAPCLGLRVVKFDACASCASSRWDGARPYRCSNRAARPRRSAVMDSRRDENTRIIAPPMPVISKPWPSSRAIHSRPNLWREGLFQVLGDDRGDRADVLVVTQRVRRPPLPVRRGPGDVGDLGVDMQLHVTVPRGVLQPVRHRQVRLVPLAGLAAVDSGAVGAGAGVPGLPLEVAEPGVHGLPDHVIDLGDQGGPVLVAVLVSGLAGQAGVLARERRGRSRSTWTATGSGRRTAGLCRTFLTASVRSSRLRSAVACGSAASSCVYTSAALRPPSGCLPSLVPSGPCAHRTAARTARARPLARLEAERSRARPHHRPGGSPPLSLAWM